LGMAMRSTHNVVFDAHARHANPTTLPRAKTFSRIHPQALL
jgi:hypothetical protein